jgi:hypothetical protein
MAGRPTRMKAGLLLVVVMLLRGIIGLLSARALAGGHALQWLVDTDDWRSFE